MMSSDFSIPTETLIITVSASFQLGNYQIEVLEYLGYFTPNVHSFKVNFKSLSEEDQEHNVTDASPLLGLLRVGEADSGLKRELDIRESLKSYGLIAPLITHTHLDSVLIDTTTKSPENDLDENVLNPEKSSEEIENNSDFSSITENSDDDTLDENTKNSDILDETPIIDLETTQVITTDNYEQKDEDETDYLEEDYLEEEVYENEENEPSKQILLLTEFPNSDNCLSNFLETYSKQDKSLEKTALNLVIQLCQCCSYLSERKWNLVNLCPNLIEFKQHLKLYDLTQIFPEKEILSIGLVGGYCAPELATGSPIHPLMSSYTVGALLYQLIHNQLPNIEQNLDFFTQPIPPVYQLLKKVLSPVPEERLILTGLRQLLLEAREELCHHKVHWETASRSTIGLSLKRLQNEDNFGVKYEQLNSQETLILGIVADGMGGMAKGEIASKIAVETLLKAPIPSEFKSSENKDAWLIEMFQNANQAIAAEVENGGTTLSVILAVNKQLMLAHVGDSRIYLLRQGEIKQLSQDHSYVALLVNNGEITEEESQTHPDKSVLLKSLGSKNPLSNGYVQNLTVTTDKLVLQLENNDTLLLCSDGVWDLVSKQQLQEIFTHPDTSLQKAVDTTIQKVLDGGAFDNATLLALQCNFLD